MPKHFEIRRGPSPSYPIVSFSLDATRPEVYLSTMEKSLHKRGYRGVVLLDLLATNGQSSRRFAQAEFDGERVRLATLRPVKPETLDAETLTYCQKFYLKLKMLDRSVLSPAVKRLLTIG